MLAGCDYTTGTPDAGKARIVNDTNRTVLIWRCGYEDCKGKKSFLRRLVYGDAFVEKFDLAPGEDAGPFNISRRGVPSVFRVLKPNPPGHADDAVDYERQSIGCLPFVMPRYIDEGLVARVSQVVPCRDSYDEDLFWPPNPAAD
jgi:hypothetical protein